MPREDGVEIKAKPSVPCARRLGQTCLMKSLSFPWNFTFQWMRYISAFIRLISQSFLKTYSSFLFFRFYLSLILIRKSSTYTVVGVEVYSSTWSHHEIHALGRTVLGKWSARRRGLLPTQHKQTQKTNINFPCGVSTRDPRNREAATLRRGQRSYRGRHFSVPTIPNICLETNKQPLHVNTGKCTFYSWFVAFMQN